MVSVACSPMAVRRLNTRSAITDAARLGDDAQCVPGLTKRWAHGVSGLGGCRPPPSRAISTCLTTCARRRLKVTVTGMPGTVPALPCPHGGRRWRRAERPCTPTCTPGGTPTGHYEMASLAVGRHRCRMSPLIQCGAKPTMPGCPVRTERDSANGITSGGLVLRPSALFVTWVWRVAARPGRAIVAGAVVEDRPVVCRHRSASISSPGVPAGPAPALRRRHPRGGLPPGRRAAWWSARWSSWLPSTRFGFASLCPSTACCGTEAPVVDAGPRPTGASDGAAMLRCLAAGPVTDHRAGGAPCPTGGRPVR